ncbi:hypothetical protein SALBM217S_01072 [Streptomyces griseoloalbus]
MLNITHGMNEILALVLAILTGTVAGAIHGFIFARIGVPAFAVTLAGLLFWQGFMLQILGDNGTINLDSEGLVVKLTSTTTSATWPRPTVWRCSRPWRTSSPRSSTTAAARPPGCPPAR